MKRLLIGSVAGAMLIVAVAQMTLPHYASTYPSSCWASLLADPRQVHSTFWNQPDIPGPELDGYTTVHWQIRRPRSFPAEIPKPSQCEYQLVFKLERGHARRLAADIAAEGARRQQRLSAQARLFLARRTAAEARLPGKSLPWNPRPTIWPGLQQFVPTEGRWQNYGGCCPYPTNRSRNLYVDVENAVAVLTYSLD